MKLLLCTSRGSYEVQKPVIKDMDQTMENLYHEVAERIKGLAFSALVFIGLIWFFIMHLGNNKPFQLYGESGVISSLIIGFCIYVYTMLTRDLNSPVEFFTPFLLIFFWAVFPIYALFH